MISVPRERVPDVSGHPDLVALASGMKVDAWDGLKTLFGFGPRIDAVDAARPEGLLHSASDIIVSPRPMHVGLRGSWRDRDALVAWATFEPHRQG